ncbi:glycosyltransferase [Paracoccus sp. S-4012]|uniref:glycosyltransferase family 4 protein n=1 Tax=Paracoccus sp. S-4012 TaxID=2665648 RepID=UPI001325449C|nr:glycosyltransferase [Paracoccus sp. S-4012]
MSGRDIAVRHYGPGGLEHGGGIGRFIGYVVDEAAGQAVRHAVTDTRGPRFSPLSSPARLSASLAVMTRDRILAPQRVHHIHIAGRGSTVRKLVLTAAARRLGCRHVLHLHDYDYAEDFNRRPARLRAAVGRMFRGADAVAVLGQRDRRMVVETLGVSADRVFVMPNCVPDPGAGAENRGDEPLILFLGRLSERKGVPELLDALAGPAMSGRRWRAVLAGDGPLADYRQRVRELGLADRVELPGWLGTEATAALCRQASIMVLPSHAEGMAMSVVEGLAHGLAVVTTRVGAHEEVITDGVTGVFVPVGDAAALGRTLAGLVADPARRAELSRAARELFLARFSMASYMPRLEAVYSRALATRPNRTVAEGQGA